ncbi:hypothetical protein [Microbacterium sp. MRS-1]|uniref:hypothetical protein n=1 Tax=Microbacterium sp. MRS-1 TaxID=1451261 RepID=UPI00044B678F|nr:hypothetical protein [Microbacterium sp. MRS-1]EXJ50913.1 hypothetical protein AS96_12215 [Microbacterium sp. MRS-1]
MIRTILRAVLWLVPVAVYIAIFLILEVEQNATFWTSVLVLAFAYVMLAVSFVAVPRSRIAAILAMPLVLVASIYFTAELIAATIFIYVSDIPYPWVIITQLILAALFLVVFLTTMSSNEAIATQIETQHADVLVIKSAVTRITALGRVAHDARLAKSLEGLAEEFRYSPTMRSNQVREVDAQIAVQLERLESLVHIQASQEETVGQIAAISGALASRNEAIKLRQ